jgi:DNA-binding MarR family transcriptional regulator
MQQEQMISVADMARLIQLASDLADRQNISPSSAVDQIVSALGARRPASAATLSNARLGRFVDRLRRLRMRRNELVGSPLFRDPAWDMLLGLFAAHEQGQQVSVSSLCYASGVPQSTALRQIVRLETHGLVERRGDPADLRRSWVKASPRALAGIGSFVTLLFEALNETHDAPGTASGA